MARVLTGLLALYYLALGAAMLIDPLGWYHQTPGVAHTGPFNPHFVIDIALAFLASGALWAAAVVLAHRRAGLAIGAALWPALHAVFHIVGWFGQGLPIGLAFWAEIGGVVLVAAAGAGLAVTLLRAPMTWSSKEKDQGPC